VFTSSSVVQLIVAGEERVELILFEAAHDHA
jgi:hypothetical protein